MSTRMTIEQFRASTTMLSRRFLARTCTPSPQAKTQEAVGEIYIYDVIGDGFFGGVSAKDVVAALEQIKKDGAKILNVYVNSPGGSVFDGLAIYNAIKRFDGQKNFYIDGLAASAGSFIPMAGDRIISAKNAMWMIHDPFGFAVGNAADMRKQADMLDQVAGTLVQTYADRTKGNADDIRKWMADETWMDSATALERGFCDEILADDDEEEGDATAQAFPLVDTFKNAPQSLRASARAPAALMDDMARKLPQLQDRARAVKDRPGQPGRK
jgi:ATP-dependent Clp protease protease subunit